MSFEEFDEEQTVYHMFILIYNNEGLLFLSTVKKAYHKLSLLVHPDRVEESIKIEATEKFKVLGRIHSILSDSDKRKIYDESGQYDEDSEEMVMRNWADYWRSLFKEITVEDINNYEKNYKGSETEIKDLKRAYMDSKCLFTCIFYIKFQIKNLKQIVSQ